MAKASATSLRDLVQSLFQPGWGTGSSARDSHQLIRSKWPAPDVSASAENADRAWLQRTEVRGSADAIGLLDRRTIGSEPSVHVLFVDQRCGLIRSEIFKNLSLMGAEKISAAILCAASNCHARGIILATNDPAAALLNSPDWRRLTAEVHRKGEAINIFLLDHLVRTRSGWEVLSRRPQAEAK